ncbi:3'-5' exonuclease [Haloferula rosea]|uniref:3'-5' exonuclease n=1 Tax=Haloferula rosea TaxID=490093 RepID=A0A934RD17_9BACT|nr:3'-5' exonuclease [Haloferula rosea]MBK1828473.1 3'-5' exonuclease domain-containing protein 2 [Haloferula rosea]
MSPSESRPRRRKPGSTASASKPQASGNAKKTGDSTPARPTAPTKAETALLPPFPGLTLDDIHVPHTHAECRTAVDEILAAGVAGFDTEARPTFRVGQKSDGPHLMQFALTDRAYLFQLHRKECEEACAKLISSKKLLKVGFGLKNDHGQIRSRFGIALNHVLDLDQTFRKLGYRGQIGVRGAMGALLKLGFKKSKSTTTSNWSRRELTRAQLLYAANDAYAALKIMEHLDHEGLLKK